MTFELSETQQEKLSVWKEAIKVIYGEYGLFEYSFTPNGIGDVVEVYSKTADKSIDLTEVDKW